MRCLHKLKKKRIAIELSIQHRVFSGSKTTPKILKSSPILRMLKVIVISLIEPRHMFMEKPVIPTFMKAKKEMHRNLLREEGENAVNGLRNESLENDLARQIAIVPTPDLLL